MGSTAGGVYRLSNAAEKAADAKNRLSGGSFELNPIVLPQVKRLSEDMANALKSRNSWTAIVAPFPNAMKVAAVPLCILHYTDVMTAKPHMSEIALVYGAPSHSCVIADAII